MAKKKKLHLLGFAQHGAMNHMIGTWAHPNDKIGYDYAQPEYWQDVGRVLERGRFDGIFIADVLAPYTTYKGSSDYSIKYAVQCPIHEPALLAPVIGLATKHLGIGVTLSTTFEPPHGMARKLATLDHLTRGRIGWNIVTSFSQGEFDALGFKDGVVPREERYDRAHEYLQICKLLWDSWAPDAVVADRETGVYADPAKVKQVDFEGKYFRCKGRSSVRRSPQVRPVLWQAGASGKGRDFAAYHADSVFQVCPTAESMRQYADDIRARAERQGRDPAQLRIFFGLQVVLGHTHAEAEAKYAYLRDHMSVEACLTIMSGHIGIDFSKYALDDVLDPNDPGAVGIRGLFDSLLVSTDGKPVTLRVAAQRYGMGLGAPVVVGTPSEVADRIEQLADEGRGDGFMIMSTYAPGSFQEFVDMVVPELQRRGRFRREYTGTTLREHLLEY